MLHSIMRKVSSLPALLVVLFAASVTARAAVLTFTPTPDPYPTGPVNYSWFYGLNWYTNDPLNNNALEPAGTVPGASDTAIIPQGAGALAEANNIILDTLIMEPGSGLTGGDFTVGTVEMLSANNGGGSGATISGSILNVSSELIAPASSVYLDSCVVTIKSGAFMQIGTSSNAANINLSDTTVYNVGQITIAPSSALEGGSNVVNMPNAVISGNSNAMFLGGSITCAFDNSGTVNCQGGTFQIGPFAAWLCSAGAGYYKAAFTNSLLQFPGGMTVPAGATNFFSGPGISEILNQGTVLGTMQIGLFDSNLMAWDPGTLDFAALNGTNGLVHVTGASGFPSAANWIDLYSSGGGSALSGPTVTIDAFGLFNFAGPYAEYALTASTINNSGTMTWVSNTPEASLTFSGGAVINNMQNATFNFQGSNYLVDAEFLGSPAPGGGSINNYGVFRKSVGVNPLEFTGSDQGPDFNNYGLLDIQSGSVELAGGVSAGTFDLEPGAELWFSYGTNTIVAGAQFIGTNFVRVTQYGDAVFNTNVTTANFSLQAGTVDGTGALTVTNAFNWLNGTVQGAGSINLPGGSTLLVSGSSLNFTQRTINSAATATMTNGALYINNGATFNNLAGGFLGIYNGGGFASPNTAVGPVPTLNNFGAFVVNTPSGTDGMYVNVTNSGVAQFQKSTAYIYGNYTQLAGSTTVASAATLYVKGVIDILGGSFTGPGNVGLGGLANPGFANSGVLNPGAPIGAPVISGPFTNTAGGVIAVVIGGVNVGTQYDQLACGSGGSLAGTLSVSFTNGFNPALGNSFVILNSPYNEGDFTGAFSTLNGLRASNGIVLVPVYNGNNVTLVAANDPVISSLSHTGNQSSFNFPSTSNMTEEIEYTLSLSPPNWLLLTNIAGDGTIKSVLDKSATNASRFYRVYIP